MADNASVSESSPLHLSEFALAPIHLLPNELLRMIFTALRPSRWECKVKRFLRQPIEREDLRAGLVCRRWRAVLLHMCAIWADLLDITTVSLNQDPEFLAYGQALVERSAPLPLSFCSSQSPRGLCTTLRPGWARITRLIVSVRSFADVPSLHTVVGWHMPRLRELMIYFAAIRDNLLPTLAQYNFKPWEDANLPNLEELETDTAYFALAGAATSSLTQLTVQGDVSAAEFRAALRRCVSLEVLSLRELRFPPEDLISGHGKRDPVHLPNLLTVSLEDGDPHSLAHLLPDLKGPPGYTLSYTIDPQDEYSFDRIMAALTPGWAFPGFRGTPSIGLVELSISTYSMVSCAASVGTSVVFTATVAPDENGVDRPMRLPVALQSFLRHFPDTATDLTVDVGPRGDDHPDLWTRALWDTVFLARPSFTDLTLAAKTDLEVKKLSAMAFITHAARASARGTAESPLPFYLTWTIDSVLEQRRPGLGEIAEELEVLGEVLTRCPLPEACTLNLLIECTTDNAAFVRCVKALEEGQVETMGESEAEAAVLTQLRRIVHGQEMVEVVVKDTRGGKSESVVLERPDEEDEEDPLL